MSSIPLEPEYTFRIFTQDVRKDGFSGLMDISAFSLYDARIKARLKTKEKALVIPHSRKDLWPDNRGKVPVEAKLTFWVRFIL